ncbi:MAG: hypothetical protein IKH09_01540 [Clostridia bacterium]|nr:hypothetical protein [Clostridia bacterium]
MVISVPPLAVSVARTFGGDIDRDRVMKTARAMVGRGFVKAGYRYLNIGDGWSAKERDEKTGSLLSDEEKLGGSLRSLSEELGSLGIKLAIVTSGGTRTPTGYPGSFGHEYEDAEFFAENGVAMIAQDFSALPRRTDPVTMIRRTGLALRAAGDSIVYSVYAGTENLTRYIRATGAHLYHLRPWRDAAGIVFPPKEVLGYSVPGSLFNCGEIAVRSNVGLTELKRSLVISAMASSPITVDADISSLDDKTVSLLTDTDIIAVATDAECRPAGIMSGEPEAVMLKVLDGNRCAAAFVNDTDQARDIPFYAYDMGLTRDARRFVFADEKANGCRSFEFCDDMNVALGSGDSALFILTLKRKECASK